MESKAIKYSYFELSTLKGISKDKINEYLKTRTNK